ncbi:MAG: sulfocyanin-like copper-binding protein [Gemmatimonadales bacterium]|nr:sulfocyanin-like copper-binding protein [Gemmatimonadales bacterium]
MHRSLPPLAAALLLAPPALAQQVPAWITADTAARTVQLALEAGRTADGRRALNGEREGSLQVIVPLGWTLKWTWTNRDTTEKRSLIVMTEREKLPERAGRPAFTNAMTRAAGSGLAPGATDVSEFVVEEPGWFWVLGGVPGHAIDGEYIGLRVDPDARGVAVRRK